MKVIKFGGTSVGSATNINRVADILNTYAKNETVICVVSAVGGITDKLINAGELAKNNDSAYQSRFEEIVNIHLQIIEELAENPSPIALQVNNMLQDLKKLLDGIFLINEISPKTSDKLVSFGELMSSFIITETIKQRGMDAHRKNSQELIVTNNQFTKADVDYKTTYSNIQNYFKDQHRIFILPGFIAKSHAGEPTTLGRGGSDFTAAIIASALKVQQLEIWTDVSGMFTANPKLVKQARSIQRLSYQEAMELSHFGAKVLYPPTVQPALDANIPIIIKNTTKPNDAGTTISNEALPEKNSVCGISNIDNIALLTLQGNGMVGVPGFSKRLFEALAQEKINVIFITQASSEHSICFGISKSDIVKAENAINLAFEYEMSLHKIDPVVIETGLSIVALVGDNMKNHQGISGKMFSALGKNNINIRAIAQGASERNISAVILEKDVKKALNALHEKFFEVKTKQINVFVTGVGNVGEKLLEQIKQQQSYLIENLHLNIRVVGLSNSKKMVFDEHGIDLTQWQNLLQNGESATLEDFLNNVTTLNLRNSIFVDITASKAVAQMYPSYLKQSIAVVACNKIACSDQLNNYKQLKTLSRQYDAPFLFETNVGAGLPVINTLNNLINSGDKIVSIQAVLSGSLNFVFNTYNGTQSFAEVVKQAQTEGYTEPDPRIDLSGVDVARKILILARESGFEIDLEDIKNDSFLTEANLAADSVDDFYTSLAQDEAHFKALFSNAHQKGCQLKYVAEFDGNHAKVGLKAIDPQHPFYNLKGKDNIVMYYTQRYADQPLIVKGAGAGADVTASGLFADVIKAGNR